MAGEKVQLTMEQLKEMINTCFQEQVKALGLTAVDRRYITVPQTDTVMGREAITPEQYKSIGNFFRGLVMPEARHALVRSNNARGERESFGEFWKDLSVASDSSGGYLVPWEFHAMVIMALEKMPVIRNLATVFPITAKDEVPAVTNKPQMYWGVENEDFDEGNVTFGNLTLTANLGRVFIPLSRRLAANARVDIVALLSKLFAQAFARGEDNAFINGSGVNMPTGLRHTALAGAETGGQIVSIAQRGASLTGDDLIDLFYTLPSQYRRNATWLVNDSVIGKIRTLKDQIGQYLWASGFADRPNTILGRPCLEQPWLPVNLGAGSPSVESEIWFGDLSFYYIGDCETMGVESTTTGGTAFRKHQLQIKAWEEIDGKVALADAFAYMTGVK